MRNFVFIKVNIPSNTAYLCVMWLFVYINQNSTTICVPKFCYKVIKRANLDHHMLSSEHVILRIYYKIVKCIFC